MKKIMWMKIGGFLFILLAMGLVFAGCGNDDLPKQVDFQTELNFSVPVTEMTTGDNINYSQFMVLDASSNPEIKKYAGNITAIDLESLEFKIDDYTTIIVDEIYLNNCVFGFSDRSSSSAQASCSVDALPITHWAGTDYFKFDSCNSTFNTISNALSKDQFVKIFIDGTLTKAPVSFTLKVRMMVRVTATPL